MENLRYIIVFSAPEPKAQVHYCDHALSVVRRPSVRPSSLTFHIFDFSSETTERNLTQLYRKVDLNVLYQVCVFRADRKNKMAALASYWLRHFRLLLWNRWTEFNETWQEARSQRPLPSLCFSGRSEKQDGRPGLWLADTFSTSPLKPLNRIQQNLTGSKISTSSTKFVFFWPIGKTRWPPWPLIGWHIFDFSSETVERNSTKLDRKQDLNVLYQVGVFRADRKNKMAALASDWLTHFRLLLWNRWKEFNKVWQEARFQHPLPSLCFSGRSKKTRWPPWPLIGWDIFDFSSETAEQNSTKLDRKQDLNVLYQVCVFRADRKNKMAALASDWLRHFDFSSETAERNSTKLDRKQDLNVLYQVCVFRADQKNKMATPASDLLRHFRLLLWNRGTEFKETWQEARSQRSLPSLCFSGQSEKQDGRTGQSAKKVAHCTQVHDMWPFGPLVYLYIAISLLFRFLGYHNNLSTKKCKSKSTPWKVVIFG